MSSHQTHGQFSGLKRDLSNRSLGGGAGTPGSALRASKRGKSDPSLGYRRKVSFGQVNDTVLFNRQDSSNNLSLGVSVSNSSFGSKTSHAMNSYSNFRWGEVQQMPSRDIQHVFTAGAPDDARWGHRFPSEHSFAVPHSRIATGSHSNNATDRVRQKMHCSPAGTDSPTCSISFGEKEQSLGSTISLPHTDPSNFMAPPRRPTRCTSPVAQVARGA
eukprot:scaffold1640_cov161-Amphora_coffeaeformis.AAC.15